ncbi:transglycosylase SLT domain-containing protein [Candidatus Parcubacteria bacterium]|nr:transglycosylase SLT domain-containing protein [Candidatus Parcubacteria bacterium]
MQIVNSLATRIYASRNYVILGLSLLAILQIPLNHVKTALPKVEFPKIKAFEDKTPLTAAFFGEEIPTNVANSIVEEKEKFVSTRGAYQASLKVIQKHEDTILEKAEEYGVPADVAIGVGLLENGGSETAKSKSGALGIFQLMPGTARNLGLTVNSKGDQRKNPIKNIDAGMRYLASNYRLFGDWGLATWAYHAGEGNVAKAVQLYSKEQDNVKLAGLKDVDQMKRYIEEDGTTVHDVLSSSAVKNFTKKLNDDSSGYPYKVLATAKLFKESK